MGRLKRMVASLGQRRVFRKMRSAAKHAFSRASAPGFQSRVVRPAEPGDAGLSGAEIDGVFSRLHSDPIRGLSGLEAEAARRRHGANVLSLNRGEHWLLRFLAQFKSPLMLLLLLTSAVSLAFSGWVDAVVIFAVVFLNGVVGFLQEHRAGKAIDALGAMVQTHATVIREGKRSRLPAEMLVPGDVVALEAGDKVPADIRLFDSQQITVDQSALTGESLPVSKSHHSENQPSAGGECTEVGGGTAAAPHMVLAGTLVLSGRGKGVVLRIGDGTEIGRIAGLVASCSERSTPMIRKIEQASRVALWVILLMALLSFLAGVLHGMPANEMFTAAVALAVGAIPEGLPAALTIVLAIGVGRMAARRVIVRNLPAVEALGSTTVICSDKTGTFTENQMTVRQVYAGGRIFGVTGTGYDPAGRIYAAGAPVGEVDGALRECLLAGALCNDAFLVREGERWGAMGDPTEVALIVSAEKAGLVHATVQEWHPRLDVIPFESAHQYMATLHGGDHSRMIYKKGALERIVSRCANELDERGATRALRSEKIHEAAERMAAEGLRVIALARLEVAVHCGSVDHSAVASGLTFLGLQAMADPPRKEVAAAVRRCRLAGISVKMITGDHVLTAVSIARRIGLCRGAAPRVVSGSEMEGMDPERLRAAVAEADIFARVSPAQKYMIVGALQRSGEVVAMTGDGVNDAPALRRADIGIAMGLSGTDVAKCAADMVLTDDNFASIEVAVEEGRHIFDNLTKFLVWTVPTNAGEALVIFCAAVFGAALPALPVQMLWVNLATTMLLGLTLVWEPREDDVMRRPPRDPSMGLVARILMVKSAVVTALVLACSFGLFLWETGVGSPLVVARTVAVNAVVVFEVFYLFSCRSLAAPAWRCGLGENKKLLLGVALMCLAQALFTYHPWMNRVFHSAPIGAEAWGRLFSVVAAAFAVVEVQKAFFGGGRK
jgi:Ca2+-transporting ATPase